MAKLPAFKRIQREDFPEAPKWVDRLIYPINQFFDSVYNALNKRLDFVDNLQGEFRTLSFTTTAAYNGTAANFDSIEFVHSLKVKPRGLLLCQIQKDGLAEYSPIEGDVYLDWVEVNGLIEIGLVRGLAASTSYTMTVLLI
jgi:hypothetical protein